MNAKNFKATIDYIEAHPEEYDQRLWCNAMIYSGSGTSSGPPCGTTRCFGGTASFLGTKPNQRKYLVLWVTAHEWLGITHDEGVYLFAPHRTWPEIKAFYENELKK